jgi:integrase
MVKSKRRSKPDKPYPEFPLFPHATKRWAKKIKGRMVYFGPWADPEGALNKYLEQKDDLYAGRKPRDKAEGFTLRDLCNQFLTSKRHLLDTRELTQRTWDDYKAVTDRLIKEFGRDRLVEDLRPEDFEQLRARLAKGIGPVTLANAIRRTRIVLKYAVDNDLVSRAIRYGQGFKPPSKKAIRKARNAKGPRMFEATELRRLLAAARQPLRAMILLGINCGFGNADCGRLPLSALDLDKGWVTFPRPKTEIVRRCPLWPETVEALREAILQRPAPKNEDVAGLVFLTRCGVSWAKDTVDNPISKEMAKLLKEQKIHRAGLNFYALRHTLETIGGETDRQAAVDHIMGHAPRGDDMSAVYRERIGNARLQAVTDHVRAWLFPPQEGQRDILSYAQAKAN